VKEVNQKVKRQLTEKGIGYQDSMHTNDERRTRTVRAAAAPKPVSSTRARILTYYAGWVSYTPSACLYDGRAAYITTAAIYRVRPSVSRAPSPARRGWRRPLRKERLRLSPSLHPPRASQGNVTPTQR
jgi:hypothetical protein